MTLLARSFTTDKLYFGVYSAIVAAVGDKKHPGEVRLRFEWFDPQMQTEWCRICNPYAGNRYGTVWHPEKDDEVLVAFLQGDMRWPIVLGGLYNGKDAPPTARSPTLDQKLWRTKGGHELLMDDTGSQKRVRIKTAAGHSVDLDDQGKKVTVTTNGKHAVTLDDGAGTITVRTSGGQSITLEAGSIKLTATSVVVNASTVKLGGDAASQSLVLGEALMAAYNLHTHNCTAPGSPSGPPLSPMTSAVLSQVSKTA
jgi:uncharacterized protein involved in type VI secretion and phage assembly